MLDTLTQFNSRDFSARYNGTYGWLVKDDQRKHLVYISAVHPEKVEFTDRHGGKYHANAGQQVMFDFLPVDRGWFVGSSGKLYLLRRVPARQWHRGICDANTTIAIVHSNNASNKDRLYAHECSLEILDDIFGEVKDRYFFKSGSSCALSQQFAIVGNILYFIDREIGTVKEDKITLGEHGAIVAQELNDLINRRNYKLEVL